MLCYTKARELYDQLSPKGSKLIYPPQNLIDLVWEDKPLRPGEPICIHPMQFTGKSAMDKLADIRTWIRKTPPITTPYSKFPPTADKHHVATLITALDSIGECPIIPPLGENSLPGSLCPQPSWQRHPLQSPVLLIPCDHPR